MEKLEVTEMVVVGWSLGEHIGIEMISRVQGMLGLMISGTPPVGPNDMARGFSGAPHSGLAAREDLSEADCEAFTRAIFGASAEPFLMRAVARADGRFRRRFLEAARAGAGGTNAPQSKPAPPRSPS